MVTKGDLREKAERKSKADNSFSLPSCGVSIQKPEATRKRHQHSRFYSQSHNTTSVPFPEAVPRKNAREQPEHMTELIDYKKKVKREGMRMKEKLIKDKKEHIQNWEASNSLAASNLGTFPNGKSRPGMTWQSQISSNSKYLSNFNVYEQIGKAFNPHMKVAPIPEDEKKKMFGGDKSKSTNPYSSITQTGTSLTHPKSERTNLSFFQTSADAYLDKGHKFAQDISQNVDKDLKQQKRVFSPTKLDDRLVTEERRRLTQIPKSL
mmetsp:Transcript_22160/g.34304  ORF Transcript_22160/g.34304 Transcript_22160/m.34304 type:complete len:264 (+) Transcript_22160:472-1263(+)